MAFALLGENEKAWELFALLNPILHGATSTQIATYKVEPHYRYRQTQYHLTITRLAAGLPGGGQLSLDGQELAGKMIPLQDDHRDHAVEMTIR